MLGEQVTQALRIVACLSAVIRQECCDVPVLHAGGFCRFCSPHGNEKVIEYPTLMQSTIHVYEVRPRKDKRGIDLIFDLLPFSRLWHSGPEAVIETQEQKGEFIEP